MKALARSRAGFQIGHKSLAQLRRPQYPQLLDGHAPLGLRLSERALVPFHGQIDLQVREAFVCLFDDDGACTTQRSDAFRRGCVSDSEEQPRSHTISLKLYDLLVAPQAIAQDRTLE